MPTKPKTAGKPKAVAEPKDRVIDAALLLAERQGWTLTTIRDIAAEAGMDISGFYDLFESKQDIILQYGRRLDDKVLRAFTDIHPETSVREIMFDVLMERFDLAKKDRPALRSILGSGRADPFSGPALIAGFYASMTKMLEAAGVATGGIKGAIRSAALSALVLWVSRVWLDDESEDLSKTMAALDKMLDRVEQTAGRFNL